MLANHLRVLIPTKPNPETIIGPPLPPEMQAENVLVPRGKGTGQGRQLTGLHKLSPPSSPGGGVGQVCLSPDCFFFPPKENHNMHISSPFTSGSQPWEENRFLSLGAWSQVASTKPEGSRWQGLSDRLDENLFSVLWLGDFSGLN